MSDASAAEYLSKVGVDVMVSELLDLLLEHRPVDPVSVITDFLQSKLTELPTVTAAYRLLQIAKRDNGPEQAKPPCEMPRGLRLSATKASDTIMRAFYKHPHEAVSFAGFYCAMNTCLLYEVFIRKTEELFASLDVHGSGYATKAVCEHVLNALAVCVGDYRHTPQSRAADDARLVELLKSDTDGPQIKLSIFLRSASNLYLKLILIMKKDGALWPKTD